MYVSGPTYWIAPLVGGAALWPLGCEDSFEVVVAVLSGCVKSGSLERRPDGTCPDAKFMPTSATRQLTTATIDIRGQCGLIRGPRALGRLVRSMGAGSMSRLAAANGSCGMIDEAPSLSKLWQESGAQFACFLPPFYRGAWPGETASFKLRAQRISHYRAVVPRACKSNACNSRLAAARKFGLHKSNSTPSREVTMPPASRTKSTPAATSQG